MNDGDLHNNIREAVAVDVTGYNLTIDQVRLKFAEKGIDRVNETFQRWCKSGRLDATEIDGPNNKPQWRIRESSADQYLEELLQVQAMNNNVSQHVGSHNNDIEPEINDFDVKPHVATGSDEDDCGNMSDQEVSHKNDNDKEQQETTLKQRRHMSELDGQIISALKDQIEAKDGTIETLRNQVDDLSEGRKNDLDFFSKVRGFLKIQIQDVFDERLVLRERVKELETELTKLTESENNDALPEAKPSYSENDMIDENNNNYDEFNAIRSD